MLLWAAIASGLAAVILMEPLWRPIAFLVWSGLALAGWSRFSDCPWRLLVWQSSGAMSLHGASGTMPCRLGSNCSVARWLIVLHILCGNKSWYFALFGNQNMDAFRRAGVRLKSAETPGDR